MRKLEGKVKVSLDISHHQHELLKMRAAKKGLSMQEYIFEALAYSEGRDEKEEEINPESFSKTLEKSRKGKANLA